ncbi:copper amine oxidase N-terminal domain-containing protein [Paenibacillus puerhi]|uniref:copper amine oxidase N-terminal domain-containing protein n=1 Tax=Paenibacillus puerhi TaxID=2692622 RepID=UPI0013592F85|nr:copper amine oxidase N-terminal domain-containing protein [Paenibacillus puerhi]
MFKCTGRMLYAAWLGAALLLLSCPFSAAAEVRPGVIVNGVKVRFPDIQPYVDANQKLMVPVRLISEQLGAKITWNDEGWAAFELGGKHIVIRLNESEALVDGQSVELDTKAVIQEGRMLVPLRFVSEALGVKVVWDHEAYTVKITDSEFEQSSPELDPWGRMIRQQSLPANAADWPYVLADIPNNAYSLGYRTRTSEAPDQQRLSSAITFNDPNLNREHLDQWANRIKRYYDLVFNVDYNEIEPEQWWKHFVPYMNETSVDSPARIQYAQRVQEQRIRIEGWAEPEPSMTYRQDGNKYVMRTYVRFLILESDAEYGVLLDAFQSSYEVKLKRGVWYSGYADILLSTNTTGNPWPYYGVTGHDHLFFTPVANIREEL